MSWRRGGRRGRQVKKGRKMTERRNGERKRERGMGIMKMRKFQMTLIRRSRYTTFEAEQLYENVPIFLKLEVICISTLTYQALTTYVYLALFILFTPLSSHP